MVRFLGIDHMINGSNPASALLSQESRQLILIPGIGITRCGHITRKDLDTS